MNVQLTKGQRVKVTGSKDVYLIMKQVLLREEKIERDKEHFWVIGMANNYRILFIELVHIGTFGKVPASPNEIFRVAVLKGAVHVILVHNHPSGELHPSSEDEQVTNRLYQAGLLLNINIADHLIITPRSYYSFADSGLLKVLAMESQYEPKYAAVAQAREKATAQTKELMARNMIREGIEVAAIARVTELSEEEVKKVGRKVKREERQAKKNNPADK